MGDPDGGEFLRELCEHHVSGQLKVAPEHVSEKVLFNMGKPSFDAYEKFAARFEAVNKKIGKEQYLVPYLMVGHPGETLQDTVELALYLKQHGLRPRQVQEFIPTPMTLATAMYWTGMDPMTGDALPVERDPRRKKAMKALLLYWDPEQWPLAREALSLAGRADLIGKLVPSARGGMRRMPRK